MSGRHPKHGGPSGSHNNGNEASNQQVPKKLKLDDDNGTGRPKFFLRENRASVGGKVSTGGPMKPLNLRRTSNQGQPFVAPLPPVPEGDPVTLVPPVPEGDPVVSVSQSTQGAYVCTQFGENIPWGLVQGACGIKDQARDNEQNKPDGDNRRDNDQNANNDDDHSKDNEEDGSPKNMDVDNENNKEIASLNQPDGNKNCDAVEGVGGGESDGHSDELFDDDGNDGEGRELAKILVRKDRVESYYSTVSTFEELVSLWLLNITDKVEQNKNSKGFNELLVTLTKFFGGCLVVNTADEVKKEIERKPEILIEDLGLALMILEMLGQLSSVALAKFVSQVDEIEFKPIIRDFVNQVCMIRMISSFKELSQKEGGWNVLPSSTKQFLLCNAFGNVRNEYIHVHAKKRALLIVDQLLNICSAEEVLSKLFWKKLAEESIIRLTQSDIISIFQLVLKENVSLRVCTKSLAILVDSSDNEKYNIHIHEFVANHWGIPLNEKGVRIKEDGVDYYHDISAMQERLYYPWKIPTLTKGILKLVTEMQIEKWELFLFGEDGFNTDNLSVETLPVFLDVICRYNYNPEMNQLLSTVINQYQPRDIGTSLAKVEYDYAARLFSFECIKGKQKIKFFVMKTWLHVICGEFMGKVPIGGLAPESVLDKFASVKQYLDIGQLVKEVPHLAIEGMFHPDEILMHL